VLADLASGAGVRIGDGPAASRDPRDRQVATFA